MTKTTTPTPYVYQEYPKWIKDLQGKDIVVQNEKEHMAVIGGVYVEPTKAIDDAPVEHKSMEIAQFARAFDLLPCDVPDAVPTGVLGLPIEPIGELDTNLVDISAVKIPKATIPIVNFPIADEKETLLKQADVLGIYYDKRWGAAKLKAAIDAVV